MDERPQRVRTIAEIAGGVGVIASLLLVAVEISQNTASVRAQTRQQLSDANVEFLVALSTSELAGLWTRFAEGDQLTEAESSQLGPALVAGVRNLENVYLQFREGVIDESALLSYGWTGSVMYDSEAFALWWMTNRDRFDPGFVAAFSSDHGHLRDR